MLVSIKKWIVSCLHSRRFWWTAGIILGIIVVIMVAFRVSPWPGALVIRAVFSSDDTKVLQALEKHPPSRPITAITNQVYREGDGDALLDVYYPEGTTTALPTIIWTHGGAWLSGSKDNVPPYYKLLAAEGFTVIAPNYSLAPERTYPHAIRQLNDMHGYIQQNAEKFHVDSSKIILAGDSAGAQLSSQMAALITNPSYAAEMTISPYLKPSQLRGVVLNCGIYKMHDLTVPDPALPRIVGWGDDVSVWAYSGTRDFNDPIVKQMSPYYHVTSAFPATYISGGNADPLTKVQSMPFADSLESLGVKVTRHFFEDDHQPALPHEYQFNLEEQDGMTALQKTIEFSKAVTTQN